MVGHCRNRTSDLVHAKHTRYQLRQAPDLSHMHRHTIIFEIFSQHLQLLRYYHYYDYVHPTTPPPVPTELTYAELHTHYTTTNTHSNTTYDITFKNKTVSTHTSIPLLFVFLTAYNWVTTVLHQSPHYISTLFLPSFITYDCSCLSMEPKH